MIELDARESIFYSKYQNLKIKSGLHSPSIYELTKQFPDIDVKIDACFLCNPYAFDLFFEYFSKIDIKAYLKNYPPNNQSIAQIIATYRNINEDRVIVGNGAIEIIETLFREIECKKILIPIPTFSSYYELASRRNEVFFHPLDKDNSFIMESESIKSTIQNIQPDYIIIVNPSNPTGYLLSVEKIIDIHKDLRMDQTLIIDESFIDFAPGCSSIENYAKSFENLIVIKSLSKDFGIAGVRLGYAVLPKDLKNNLYRSGYLWNINGLAFAFSKFLNDTEFIKKYDLIKEEYRKVRDDFFLLLKTIPRIKVYPSEANFFLIETETNSEHLFIKLLLNHGIYIRVLNDKIGMKGNFIRIACKDTHDNLKIFQALKKSLNIQQIPENLHLQ